VNVREKADRQIMRGNQLFQHPFIAHVKADRGSVRRSADQRLRFPDRPAGNGHRKSRRVEQVTDVRTGNQSGSEDEHAFHDGLLDQRPLGRGEMFLQVSILRCEAATMHDDGSLQFPREVKRLEVT